MSEESPVTCEGCGKLFANVAELSSHQIKPRDGRLLMRSACYRAGMQRTWQRWWENRLRESSVLQRRAKQRAAYRRDEQIRQSDDEAAGQGLYRRTCDICDQTFYTLRPRTHICYRFTCHQEHRRRKREARRTAQATAVCAMCQQPMTGKRTGAKFCSGRCRQAHYRGDVLRINERVEC